LEIYDENHWLYEVHLMFCGVEMKSIKKEKEEEGRDELFMDSLIIC